jgi:hypothetical protein
MQSQTRMWTMTAPVFETGPRTIIEHSFFSTRLPALPEESSLPCPPNERRVGWGTRR